MYGIQHKCPPYDWVYAFMFGMQAKLPVELTYGAPETETLLLSQYAMTVKASLGEAYARVRERTS